jgi:hypothetical protein
VDSSTITIAIISFVVPLLLAWMARAGALGVVRPGEVRYSRAFRWGFTFLGFGPSAGVAVLAVLQKDPLDAETLRTVVLLMLFFPAVVAPLLLELLRVRHRFNDVGVAVQSPWSRARVLEWSEVTTIRWRKHAKWLDLSTASGATVHLSPLLSGLGPFADMALARIHPDVLGASSPDARAALRLMSLGEAGPLLASQESPEQLLASAAGTKRS